VVILQITRKSYFFRLASSFFLVVLDALTMVKSYYEGAKEEAIYSKKK
jgi:hypothetical protein